MKKTATGTVVLKNFKKIIVKSVILLVLSCSITVGATQGTAPIHKNPSAGKKIALTFDDGPHYKYTEQILDILKKYDVKATFFTVGELAVKYPELVMREYSEGHEIGNHTFSHLKMKDMSCAELKNEILSTGTLIENITGKMPVLFRPPEGVLSDCQKQTVADCGYSIILWSVDTRDWAHTPVAKIVKNVMKNTSNGSIILCHDFIGKNSPTPEALEEFIPKLKENGYEFVTVSELIDQSG